MHADIAAVPEQRLAQERLLLAPLPSLQLRIGPAPVLRKVDKLSCVRIGSARYSVPMKLIGTSVQVVSGSGRVLIVDPRSGEVVADHALRSPPVKPPWSTSTTAVPGPAPRRAIRPKTLAEKAFCGLGAVGGGVPGRRRRGRTHPPGARAR